MKRHAAIALAVFLLWLTVSQPILPSRAAQTPTQRTITYQNPIVYLSVDKMQIAATGLNARSTTLLAPRLPLESESEILEGGNKIYGGVRWSPDRTQFAFVNGAEKRLYIVKSGSKPVVVPNAEPTGPWIAWSPDGKQIAFMGSSQSGQSYDLQRIDLATGQIHFVVTVGRATASGIGTDPSHEMFEREWENHWSTDVISIDWIEYGLVFDGTHHFYGLPQDDNSPVQVSDGGGIIREGIGFTPPSAPKNIAQSIVIRRSGVLDTASNKPAMLPIPKGAKVEAFTLDGSQIIYSTATVEQRICWKAEWAENDCVLPFSEHTLSLWQMPVQGGQASKIFSRRGHSFGRFTVLPDNSTVIFSFIPASLDLVRLENRGLSYQEAFDKVGVPQVEIIAVPLNVPNPQPQWITLGGQPAAGPASFTFVVDTEPTPTPAKGCPKESPPRLTVGQRAQVTPGIPNLLREKPFAGVTVGHVKGGETVLVLKGPECGADGRAWWQVNYKGTVGWTAEGDGNTYWLEP